MNRVHEEYYRGFEIKRCYEVSKQYSYQVFENGVAVSMLQLISPKAAKNVIDTHIRYIKEMELYPNQKSNNPKKKEENSFTRPKAEYNNTQWNQM